MSLFLCYHICQYFTIYIKIIYLIVSEDSYSLHCILHKLTYALFAIDLNLPKQNTHMYI